MKTYFDAHEGHELDGVLYETDSLKGAKKWVTQRRYYLAGLRVPRIYIRLNDGRVELASVGEYNRHTHRTKWEDVY